MRNICFALILALPLAAEVKVQKGDNRVDVEIGGKPFTTFYFGPDTTKPYLHPLHSASGKVITRLYPMEKVTERVATIRITAGSGSLTATSTVGTSGGMSPAKNLR